MHVGLELLEKYGDVVRVSKLLRCSHRININLICVTDPKHVIFAEKSAIQKILVEEDFKKAPIYDHIRGVSSVGTLFSERDKVKYKQAVLALKQSQSL